MKTIVEELNDIANALGDENPDEITTIDIALQHIKVQYGGTAVQGQTINEALGDIATAIENGGGGGGGDIFIATCDTETALLDKTWQEIHDALDTLGVGKVFVRYGDDGCMAYIVASTNVQEGFYNINIYRDPTGEISYGYYYAESADGYPTDD